MSGPTSAKVLFDADLSHLERPYKTCAGYTCHDGTPQMNAYYNDYWTDLPNSHDYGVVALDQAVSMGTHGSLPELGALDDLSSKKGRKLIVRTVSYGLRGVKPGFQEDRIRHTSISRIASLSSANQGGFWAARIQQCKPDPGQGLRLLWRFGRAHILPRGQQPRDWHRILEK